MQSKLHDLRQKVTRNMCNKGCCDRMESSNIDSQPSDHNSLFSILHSKFPNKKSPLFKLKYPSLTLLPTTTTKQHQNNCSAWSRLQPNTKIGLNHHHHHHPPPPPPTENFQKGSRHSRRPRFDMQASLRSMNQNPKSPPPPPHPTPKLYKGQSFPKLNT